MSETPTPPHIQPPAPGVDEIVEDSGLTLEELEERILAQREVAKGLREEVDELRNGADAAGDSITTKQRTLDSLLTSEENMAVGFGGVGEEVEAAQAELVATETANAARKEAVEASQRRLSETAATHAEELATAEAALTAAFTQYTTEVNAAAQTRATTLAAVEAINTELDEETVRLAEQLKKYQPKSAKKGRKVPTLVEAEVAKVEAACREAYEITKLGKQLHDLKSAVSAGKHCLELREKQLETYGDYKAEYECSKECVQNTHVDRANLLADLKAEEARLRSLVDKTDEELSHALDAEREAAVAAYEAAMVERGTEVGLDVAVVGADVLEMWGAEEAKVKLAEEEEDNTADHVAALDARTAELETLVAANKTTLLEKRDEVLAQHKINTRQAATLIAKHNQKIRMPEDPEIIKEYLNELKRNKRTQGGGAGGKTRKTKK